MAITCRNEKEVKPHRMKRMLAPTFPMLGAGLCLIAAWVRSGQSDWAIVAAYIAGSVILGTLASGVLICAKLDERIDRLEEKLNERDPKSGDHDNNTKQPNDSAG